MKPNAKITDLTLDSVNLNAHTERGTYMTRKSIEKFGSRLAGIIDAKNRVIDANLRTETYADSGIDEVMIIDASPDVPVYLRFNDLDLGDSDNPARELQLALHRSAVESFNVDAEHLGLAILENPTIAEDWFFRDELDEIMQELGDEFSNIVEDVGMDFDEDVCKCCGKVL